MSFRPASKFQRGSPSKPKWQSPREKALAAWRGIDLAPLLESQKNSAQGIGKIIPNVLKELKLDRRQGEVEIVKVWNNLIDPAITAHAQPCNVAKGTLFINVDSPVWLNEIVRYRRKELLKLMQHSFGSEVIKKISFRIG